MYSEILSSVAMINERAVCKQVNKIALSQRTRICVTAGANNDQIASRMKFSSAAHSLSSSASLSRYLSRVSISFSLCAWMKNEDALALWHISLN